MKKGLHLALSSVMSIIVLSGLPWHFSGDEVACKLSDYYGGNTVGSWKISWYCWRSNCISEGIVCVDVAPCELSLLRTRTAPTAPLLRSLHKCLADIKWCLVGHVSSRNVTVVFPSNDDIKWCLVGHVWWLRSVEFLNSDQLDYVYRSSLLLEWYHSLVHLAVWSLM